MAAAEGLPDLDGDRPAADLASEFADRGHVCLRGLATPDEVAAYGPVLIAVARGLRWENRPLAERDTYGRAFLQMFNLWRSDPRAAGFVLAPRFGRVAAELMGVDGVRIYHDQALVKEAGGGSTPWHQDQGYWPLDTDHTITMWMPLVAVPEAVGSMTFVDGSHRGGDVGAGHISDDSHRAIGTQLERDRSRLSTHGAMVAGDATFHAGWTLHSAGPNPSDTDRPVMTVIYVADGARITSPSDQQRLDMRWLGGRGPGERVDSELNPVVWPR